jgi:hypothetical protein
MREVRKHYSAEEKGAILRRHLLHRVPVSDLCEETSLAADCVLPLAEGVLRERSGCLPVPGAPLPLGGGEAETD